MHKRSQAIRQDPAVLPLPATGSYQPQRLGAHKGFVNAFGTSISKVSQALERAIAASNISGQIDMGHLRVLFTGHSAGGALAQLLLAHFATRTARCTYSDMQASSQQIGRTNQPYSRPNPLLHATGPTIHPTQLHNARCTTHLLH